MCAHLSFTSLWSEISDMGGYDRLRRLRFLFGYQPGSEAHARPKEIYEKAPKTVRSGASGSLVA